MQQGFRIQNIGLVGWPMGCPKFCPDYFSLTTEGIVLIFFDMIYIDIIFARKFKI